MKRKHIKKLKRPIHVIERATYQAIIELLFKDMLRAGRAPGQANYLCAPEFNLVTEPFDICNIAAIRVVVVEKHAGN